MTHCEIRSSFIILVLFQLPNDLSSTVERVFLTFTTPSCQRQTETRNITSHVHYTHTCIQPINNMMQK